MANQEGLRQFGCLGMGYVRGGVKPWDEGQLSHAQHVTLYAMYKSFTSSAYIIYTIHKTHTRTFLENLRTTVPTLNRFFLCSES